jgi:hypothetical protein
MAISCDLLNHWVRDHSELRSIDSFVVPELDFKREGRFMSIQHLNQPLYLLRWIPTPIFRPLSHH